MDYSRLFGWFLLILGIGIIGWTLLSSYNIFTGKAAVSEIFELPQEESGAPIAQEQITGIEDIQAQIQKMLGEQMKGIFPTDALPKILNLVIWSMLAFILISGGGQIASLGIKLIKK